MEQEQRRAAKEQMLELMEAGVSWQEAATTAGVQTSRATAYRWRQEARTRGEAALQDGRHGHPAKVLPPYSTGWGCGVRRPRWLQAANCKENCKSSWECG